MKILLDFNAKVGRKYVFEPAVGNEILHEISNDNGIGVVNFSTSKNLIIKEFPRRSIHKSTWISCDGKTHNQSGHVLIDKGDIRI
jgi:hypothetical protein